MRKDGTGWAERCRVVSGNPALGYKAYSLDRPGVSMGRLAALGNGSYAEGDHVYCICFPDGTGMVLGKM